MRALDLVLFEWIAAGLHPNPWLLSVAIFIAQQGAWLSVLVLAGAAWRQPAERVYLIGTLAAAAVTSVLAHALATAIDLPRPFVLGVSPAYIAHGARGSLPSTHAAVMSVVAAIMLMRPGLRQAGMLAAAAAALTGWARIHVGVHFPFDIVGGVVLAVAVAGMFQLVRRAFAYWSGPLATPVRPKAQASAEVAVPVSRTRP